jgi:glycosyltransferase involved in cell wall biosynthesis
MRKKQVDVFLIFHHEGLYAVPAINSALALVANARGFANVNLHAVLDYPDELTEKIVNLNKDKFSHIHNVSFGDLGTTRNYCVEISNGTFIAMLDGDDLWSSNWVSKCLNHVVEDWGNTVLHPEFLFYFSEDHSSSGGSEEKSFFIRHQPSSVTSNLEKTLFLSNPWSANNFMSSELAREFPYKPTDRIRGLGVEDWSWNLETVHNGVLHEVVPGTVHFIRLKPSGSLGNQNMLEGLSIYLPERRR